VVEGPTVLGCVLVESEVALLDVVLVLVEVVPKYTAELPYIALENGTPEVLALVPNTAVVVLEPDVVKVDVLDVVFAPTVIDAACMTGVVVGRGSVS